MWRLRRNPNPLCHPERSEGPAFSRRQKQQVLRFAQDDNPLYYEERLRTTAGRGPVGHGERRAVCRVCRDPQFHSESDVAGSRRLQETAAMFFEDAAAGAQRKGRRLVPTLEVKHRWERECPGRGIVRGEVNQDEVTLAVRANEQGGVYFAMEMGANLSGKVQADVENLVGVGEHVRKRRSEFELDRIGLRFQLGSKQADGGLQHGVDVEGGKLDRSLTGKSEQARHQRGGAADLLADLRGLELFLGWQGGRAEQVGVSQHGGERIVDFVGGSAHQLAEGSQLLGLYKLLLQGLKVVERAAGSFEKQRKLGSEQALPPENHDAHQRNGQQTHGNAEGLDR